MRLANITTNLTGAVPAGREADSTSPGADTASRSDRPAPLRPRGGTVASAPRPRAAWAGALRTIGATLGLAGDRPCHGPAAPGLHTSAQAPIKTLDEKDFVPVHAAFQASLAGWVVKGARNPRAGAEDVDQRAWRPRTQNIGTALTHMERHATNVAYMFEGRPVGLMSVTRPKAGNARQARPYLQVHGLATHPGSSGVGGALVEHAVNLAQRDGAKGVVRLTPLEAAMTAYEAMGFTTLPSSGIMQLDPRTSDKWTRQAGQWRLAKHADQAYADGLPDAAALSAAGRRPPPSAR